MTVYLICVGVNALISMIGIIVMAPTMRYYHTVVPLIVCLVTIVIPVLGGIAVIIEIIGNRN